MKIIAITAFLAVALTANAQQAQLQAQRQIGRQLNRQVLQNTNTNQNLNRNRNFNTNTNTNTSRSTATGGRGGNARASGGNSTAVAPTAINFSNNIPDATVNTDYVAWKRYQWERAQHRTKRGAGISPLDPRAAKVAVVIPLPKDPKARYDAFLMEQGVNPNTIGHATLADGKMVVPTVDQAYTNPELIAYK